MPAYANRDGKVVVFFRDAGTMWPSSFALLELTPADEKKIASLVKKAVS
jgi:hypothetical protein